MIVDAHCHAWERWPYQPPVPDPHSRALVEQLLFEMDANGVGRAVVICAAIGDNPRNVDYVMDAARRHPGRLAVFPDLECRWAGTCGTPGAARRLELALSRWEFPGFTLYLDEAGDGGWLGGEEGRAFFAQAAERRLIASLSILPHQAPAVGALAARHPAMPILLHHHGFLGPRTAATPDAMALVTALATHRNVFVKASGMGNVAVPDDEYPYAGLSGIPRALRRAFGAGRMVWGSDYPVSRRHMTYRQALAMITRHGPFEAHELAGVLGGTMSRLLDARAAPPS
jgi:predicted TIM-barrel fold metal-dependent hydrolase